MTGERSKTEIDQRQNSQRSTVQEADCVSYAYSRLLFTHNYYDSATKIKQRHTCEVHAETVTCYTAEM